MNGNPKVSGITVRERIEDYERQLREFENRIQTQCCDLLKQGLGGRWIEHVRREIHLCYQGIDRDEVAEPLHSETAIPFFLLRHGRTLERFDECIRGIDAATQKKAVLSKQIDRISHLDRGNVLGEIFEIFVVGEFARSGKLLDIAVRPSGDSTSDIDATVGLGDREAFIECSLITKDLAGPDSRIGYLSVDAMMAQMEKKIVEKAEAGRQLALADSCAVLVVGLPGLGCDDQSAKWKIQETWKAKRATEISAIAVVGSWELRGAEVYENPNAEYPLTCKELEELRGVLNPSLPDDYDPFGVRLANEYLKNMDFF